MVEGNRRPALRLDPEKVAKRARELAEVVEDGELFMRAELGESMIEDVTNRERLFNILASEFPKERGKAESRRERDEKGIKETSMTYGEIEFRSLCLVFKWIQKTYNAFEESGGVFMDLGHGTGKGLLAAALMHEFEQCQGIELLASLQDVSLELKRTYEDYLCNTDAQEYLDILGWPKERASTFDPILGDMFQIDWHNSDFIFANLCLFNAELMEQVYQRSLKCKKGTWFVTTAKRLPHAERMGSADAIKLGDQHHWEFILAVKLKTSWGHASLNLQRKRTDPIML